jgi:hypothetical protein
VLDREGAITEGLCLIGVFVYALHSIMIVAEERTVRSSMLVHHLLAIAIQSIFWLYADSPERPFDMWKTFAWTELGSTLHKLSPFIPNFRSWRFKRHYQAFYLSCYLVIYAIIIAWIATLNRHHPTRSHLLGISSELWHVGLAYGLISLLIFWSYQSFHALRHVIAHMRAP